MSPSFPFIFSIVIFFSALALTVQKEVLGVGCVMHVWLSVPGEMLSFDLFHLSSLLFDNDSELEGVNSNSLDTDDAMEDDLDTGGINDDVSIQPGEDQQFLDLPH